MTPTDTDTAQDIIRRLAEMPCLECEGRGTHIKSFPAGRDDVDCPTQGRALPWASVPCDSEWHKDVNWRDRMVLGGLQCPRRCENGRVPKTDLGLEELLARASSQEDFVDIMLAVREERFRAVREDDPPNYMLAALKVVEAQVGMR